LMVATDSRSGDDVTEAEQVLLDGSAAGAMVDGGPGPYELADMQVWGPDRTVRAAVLRRLLVAGDWPVHDRGVQLRGLQISGHLNLEHASLRYPLQMECCYVPDGVSLTGATVSLLSMQNCRVAGLAGDALSVTRFLDFGGSTFDGPVRLMVADIRGGLSFRGCGLDSTGDDGVVLFAERIKVDGSVFLDSQPGRAFVADGSLRLSGATITGDLSCVGAQLGRADRDGTSLMAAQIKVAGNVALMPLSGTTGFSAKGTVNLVGADIAGNLLCNGASLGGGPGQDALTAAGMKVGGGVLLGSGFSAAGAIELRGARITANLAFRYGAQLNGANADGNALHATGISIGENLHIYEGFTAADVIDLTGAEIIGDAEILGARLSGVNAAGSSLAASGLKVGGGMILGDGLTAAGAIELRGARIAANFACQGATKLDGANAEGNALQADALKVGGNLFIRDSFASRGAIDLVDAEIGGNLECRGVHLRGRNQKGSALHAERITVGSQVYLDQGFRADGAIYLLGAHINGNLECRGAQVRSGANGRALYAERMTVGGDVYLDSYPGLRSFTADGTVYLLRAEIGGVLSCRGAQLRASGAPEGSLFAQRVTVGNDVYLSDGLSASGTIQLRAAIIGGSLELAPDRLQPDKRWLAVDATDLKVSGRLRWAPERPVQGRVSLEGAAIGQLEDAWTDTSGQTRENGYWPTGGRLRLDGFTYGGFTGVHQASARQRLHWIRSQYQPRLPEPWEDTPASRSPARNRAGDFAAQPYQQLIQAFQRVGRETGARTAAIALRRDRWKYGPLAWYRKIWDCILDIFIGYGYRIWRIVVPLTLLFAVVWAFVSITEHHNGFEAAQNATLLHPAPSATRCENGYPCFSALGYTIDTVIPLIDVHQTDYWAPNAKTSWGTACVDISYAGTALGWFFATLALAGATGIVRRIDPS
jgi:hypothetical protein